MEGGALALFIILILIFLLIILWGLSQQPRLASSGSTGPLARSLPELRQQPRLSDNPGATGAAELAEPAVGAGSLPPGSLPPGSLPPGSLPPGSLPPGSLPPGALPPGSLPPGALPPGAPPGALPESLLPNVIEVGKFVVFDTDVCAYLPTCFGQNPDSPYARLIFPAGIRAAANGTQRAIAALGGFYLQPNQVVVIRGRSPPRCRYFGFTAYLFARANGTVPFASLGDTLNETDIPFDRDFTLVVAGSHIAAQDILARASQPTDARFILPIPMADTVLPTDALLIVMRTAFFRHQASGTAYLRNLPITGTLVASQKIADGLYARAELTPHPTEPSEEPFQRAFDAHVASEVRRMRNAGLTPVARLDFHPFLASIHYNSGYDCIDQNAECLGDNRDAAYLVTDPVILGPNQALVVVGVNHTTTGKGIYVSESLYDYDKQFGLKAFSDNDLPDGDQFYTFAFSRAEIPRLRVPTYVMPPDVQRVNLAERTYVQPGSTVGPSPDSLVKPVAYVVNLS
jgi:hypothetical protein